VAAPDPQNFRRCKLRKYHAHEPDIFPLHERRVSAHAFLAKIFLM
jgi:hypothetical protein